MQGVRDSLLESPYTRKEGNEIHFHNMGDSSLNVLVYAFFEVDSWTAELEGRQQLMLAWMKLAEDIGVQFAFPTQSLFVEKLPT